MAVPAADVTGLDFTHDRYERLIRESQPPWAGLYSSIRLAAEPRPTANADPCDTWQWSKKEILDIIDSWDVIAGLNTPEELGPRPLSSDATIVYSDLIKYLGLRASGNGQPLHVQPPGILVDGRGLKMCNPAQEVDFLFTLRYCFYQNLDENHGEDLGKERIAEIMEEIDTTRFLDSECTFIPSFDSYEWYTLTCLLAKRLEKLHALYCEYEESDGDTFTIATRIETKTNDPEDIKRDRSYHVDRFRFYFHCVKTRWSGSGGIRVGSAPGLTPEEVEQKRVERERKEAERKEQTRRLVEATQPRPGPRRGRTNAPLPFSRQPTVSGTGATHGPSYAARLFGPGSSGPPLNIASSGGGSGAFGSVLPIDPTVPTPTPADVSGGSENPPQDLGRTAPTNRGGLPDPGPPTVVPAAAIERARAAGLWPSAEEEEEESRNQESWADHNPFEDELRELLERAAAAATERRGPGSERRGRQAPGSERAPLQHPFEYMIGHFFLSAATSAITYLEAQARIASTEADRLAAELRDAESKREAVEELRASARNRNQPSHRHQQLFADGSLQMGGVGLGMHSVYAMPAASGTNPRPVPAPTPASEAVNNPGVPPHPSFNRVLAQASQATNPLPFLYH